MESAMYSTFQSSPIIMIVAVSTIVPFLIYLVYKFSIKEKSFEEALEEQKRQSFEEEMRQKAEKTKKEKKFKRGWAKKKEKPEPEAVPDVPQPQEKVEIPKIEIVEPKEEKSPKQQKNTKKANPVPNQTIEAAPEAPKAKKAENVEKTQERNKGMPSMEKETKSSPKYDAPKVEEKDASTQVGSPVLAPPPVISVPKKKKKEQVEKVDVVPMNTTKLLCFIKEAALDTEEIQNIIDILLNKQKDSTGWTKPNDQLADTKRNLHETQQQLDQELRQNQAVVSTLKDLREEYNKTKTRYAQLEKSSQEKVQKQQQDIQSLTTRLKQVQEQCNLEKDKLVKLEKQVEEGLAASLKTVEDEKVKLQEKLAKLQAESQSGVTKSELEAVKKSREELQKVHTLLVDQHTQLVTSHKNDLKSLTAQLVDTKKQFEEVSAKNTILAKDVQSFREAKIDAEKSKKVLEDKLMAAEKQISSLDIQVRQVTDQVAALNQLQTDVKTLQLENERLTDQLVSTKERVAGDGQEILHQNGEVNEKAVDSKSLQEKETLLKEKENVVQGLNEELVTLKDKYRILDEEAEVQKKKNNELQEKNWKAMEALKKVEEDALLKVKEVQTASAKKLTQLQVEYEEKLRVAHLNSFNGHSEHEAELAKRLSDYNGVVEKNMKLTSELERCSVQKKDADSRLEHLDKNVQDLTMQIKECQTRTRECLQRIHPQVSIDSSLSHDAWLAQFEKQAAVAVQTASSSDANELAQLRMLTDEMKKQLACKEEHFTRLLADTESMLHKLQVKADNSEVEWQKKLTAKKLEYQQVKNENAALKAEKKEFESTFQQIEQLKEMQEKLQQLQNTLETAETERAHVEQKFEEVNKNCINLRDQLANKENELKELQTKGSDITILKHEIEDLKEKLDKERKINKDFSSQMVRFTSLVKIGTESLAAEQAKVVDLEKQLKAAKVAATNGGTQTALPSSIVTESQPKPKSSEKSKKKGDASVKK